MAKGYTVQQFFKDFPNDDACLDHLMMVRYGDVVTCPKCEKRGKFARLKKLPAYACSWCGHHIHPMAGTPFENTRTPLQKWFYAMYLFTTTRNGVSAKEIQRQLGVTYKTAWRIGHEIRKYMGLVDGDGPIGRQGIVEIDKSFIGGKDKQGQSDKAVVLGMVERDGDLATCVVKDRSFDSVIQPITYYVQEGAKVATDTANAFKSLPMFGYAHGTVNHSKGEYVRGPVHTNTIESFWAWLKRGIEGTHVWVSRKHLPKYLGEFEFRFNLRKRPHLMFDLLLASFPAPSRTIGGQK